MKDGKLSVRSSKADLGMQSLQVVYGQKEVCSCRPLHSTDFQYDIGDKEFNLAANTDFLIVNSFVAGRKITIKYDFSYNTFSRDR